MRSKLLLLLPFVSLLCSLAASQNRSTVANPPKVSSIYITHVTVIDTTSGQEALDRTVILSGGRIFAVTGSTIESHPPARG
jgi:hypothetical protein